MNKRILIIGLTIALLLSACGANEPAVPTVSSEDIRNTAEAAAFTMVAQTQAAIPTNTPTETPTQTPLPTDTPVLLPTLEATVALPTPTTASSASGDPCDNRILSWSPKGKPTVIRIVNTVKAAITVSVYLNETASHNECGWRTYQIGARDSVQITDLVQGCYNFWAFNNDSKNLVNASTYLCINNPDKWTFEVSKTAIKNTTP
ncbi:MAG: hypothetical protein HXY35_09550 [Chloroflexi bacterium]|nr:hypothetical protein [Chloroflexota bacterium]